jgi:Dolichyl-phosphate-mannose-protein mannosyltransferase
MTAETQVGPTEERPALAAGPVWSAAAALAVLLTVTSNAYGYHRDELYFRMLDPAWGYVDQPPFTPFIARLTTLIADEPWALRIPATAAAVVALLVLVAIIRELGGGSCAQTICAWGYVTASTPLVMEHILLTSTFDLAIWPALCLFLMRALLRNRQRWWLAAGALLGLSTFNKLLIAMLAVALIGGLLLAGQRRVLLSRGFAGAAGLAVLTALPALIYQVTHDWPQLDMGAALAENNAAETRVMMWPFLFLLLGPPLVPVWVAGLVALWRRPEWRPVRAIAVAFPLVLLFTFVSGGQQYYPMGIVLVLFAAGCIPVADWLTTAARRRTLAGLIAVNGLVSAVIALPILPVRVFGDTPIPGINQAARDTVGWPVYVDQIAAGYRELGDPTAAIVTSNYGEAGAVDRFGPAHGLPPPYSGHNELHFTGRPLDTATSVLAVGIPAARLTASFASCREVGRLDNGVGVENEEQQQPLVACSGRTASWDVLWPQLQHYD